MLINNLCNILYYPFRNVAKWLVIFSCFPDHLAVCITASILITCDSIYSNSPGQNIYFDVTIDSNNVTTDDNEDEDYLEFSTNAYYYCY